MPGTTFSVLFFDIMEWILLFSCFVVSFYFSPLYISQFRHNLSTASFVLLPVPPPPPPKVVVAPPEPLPASSPKKPSTSVFSKVMTSFSGPNDGFDKCPVCAKTVPKGKRVVCAGAPWHIACFGTSFQWAASFYLNKCVLSDMNHDEGVVKFES